jgi:hypothetical protein
LLAVLNLEAHAPVSNPQPQLVAAAEPSHVTGPIFGKPFKRGDNPSSDRAIQAAQVSLCAVG